MASVEFKPLSPLVPNTCAQSQMNKVDTMILTPDCCKTIQVGGNLVCTANESAKVVRRNLVHRIYSALQSIHI